MMESTSLKLRKPGKDLQRFLLGAFCLVFGLVTGLLPSRAAGENIDRIGITYNLLVENYLVSKVTERFSPILGTDRYWLNVTAKVDTKSALEAGGFAQDEFDDGKPSLPGMYTRIMPSVAEIIKESQPALLVPFITSLTAELQIQDDSLLAQKDAVSQSLSAIFKSFGVPKVNIKIVRAKSVSIETKQHHLAGELRSVGEGISSLANLTEKISTDYKPLVFWFLGCIGVSVLTFLGLGMFFLRNITTNTQKLIGALKSLSADSGQNESAVASDVSVQRAPAAGNSSGKGIDDSIQKVRSLLDNYPELTKMMPSYLMKREKFAHLFILWGILTREERQPTMQKQNEGHLKRFFDYVRNSGHSLLEDDQAMIQTTSELFRMIWIAAQDQDSLLISAVRDGLDGLTDAGLAGFIESLSEAERVAAFGFLKFDRLGYLISSGLLPISVAKDIESLTTNAAADAVSLEALLGKLNNLQRPSHEEAAAQSPMQELASYLSSSFEQALGSEFGFKPMTQWNDHIESVVKWVGNLSMPDAAALLSTLDERYRDLILKELPEIKAARLRIMGKNLTRRGLALKAQLSSHLRAQFQSDSRTDVEEQGNAA